MIQIDNINVDQTDINIMVAALSKYSDYISHKLRESINKDEDDVAFYSMMLSQTNRLYNIFKTKIKWEV